ncbi:glycosyltransferase family 4 protein [Microbacterium sp. cx-55]|uniref:glycosyltransferase family 4 protein n=1 Tax=Microbacterium sp. cx-55 TaxID=2875948 RepID=UPI001CBC2211|nr:glycosyltransferase family 4 protein [Microbacterium sp. cx-55]MBZ4486903.1 glycosyltransferase family 4 protein [Microbacterium sp. cx-55]UGB35826.1 glycosyltransferase family 4 protein [Microbacterium sp. cx-55]
MSAARTIRRVAFVHPSRGPLTERDWSGTPAGLVTALRARGIEVEEIGYDVPAPVRAAVHLLARATTPNPTAAERSPLKVWLRERSLRRQLARVPPVDAVIAVGTDCFRLGRLEASAPTATYDDASLSRMWAHPDSDIRQAGFREADVARWIAVQRASQRAATVACVSTAWAGRSLVRGDRMPEERIAVVGMGHRPRDDGGEASRDWASPTFLFIGVDWRRKNGDAVLRAFRRVRADFPRATLHLVGAHERVDEDGVIDHGLLAREDPRAQAELDGVLRSATAFVLPSTFEPFGIAYLEAASAGLPVIATTEGGAGEMLGDAAITVAPGDDDAILRAMLMLCRPQEAERRGRLARAAARESSWGHVAGRILDALESAAAPEREANRAR